jgi:hypothetical protein
MLRTTSEVEMVSKACLPRCSAVLLHLIEPLSRPSRVGAVGLGESDDEGLSERRSKLLRHPCRKTGHSTIGEL